MRLLDQFSIQKRLWVNLLIVIAFLTAVVLTARYALLDVRQSAHDLEQIQETQSARIAEFQTHFSNTLLKMNDYTRTLDEEAGDTFNQGWLN